MSLIQSRIFCILSPKLSLEDLLSSKDISSAKNFMPRLSPIRYASAKNKKSFLFSEKFLIRKIDAI